MSSNINLSEFLHRLSSLNAVTRAFFYRLENNKGNIHFNPLLATCLTQLLSWCHKKNNSKSAALSKLISGHEFTLCEQKFQGQTSGLSVYTYNYTHEKKHNAGKEKLTQCTGTLEITGLIPQFLELAYTSASVVLNYFHG